MTESDKTQVTLLPHVLGGRAPVVTGRLADELAGRRTLAEMLELVARIEARTQAAAATPVRRRGLRRRPRGLGGVGAAAS